MPNENAGSGQSFHLPPELAPDRAAFRDALASEADRRAPGDPIAALLRDPRRLESWDGFAALVFQHSAKLALVAEGDRARIYTRHILDSLNPLEVLWPSPGNILDIGAGAGFPGIPLSIAWPGARVTLLEAREKKVGFLERAIRELSLRNATAVSARLEEYGRSWRAEPADAVVIRAVGGLATLLEHASRAARPGGRWVYFLGSAERAAELIGTLAADALHPSVQRGIFAGALLTGSFHASP